MVAKRNGVVDVGELVFLARMDAEDLAWQSMIEEKRRGRYAHMVEVLVQGLREGAEVRLVLDGGGKPRAAHTQGVELPLGVVQGAISAGMATVEGGLLVATEVKHGCP